MGHAAQSVAIVGLPGSGKSTVGRALSVKLGIEFIDVDSLIELQTGVSVREYFGLYGEDQFRSVEQSVICSLAGDPRRVVATGGGAVVSSASRHALREMATVIYLKAIPEDIIQRLDGNSDRPLMQVADPLGRLHTLFRQRDPLYQETAHIQILLAKGDSVEMIVDSIQNALNRYGRV